MKERIWINRVVSEIVFHPFVCMTTQLEGTRKAIGRLKVFGR